MRGELQPERRNFVFDKDDVAKFLFHLDPAPLRASNTVRSCSSAGLPGVGCTQAILVVSLNGCYWMVSRYHHLPPFMDIPSCHVEEPCTSLFISRSTDDCLIHASVNASIAIVATFLPIKQPVLSNPMVSYLSIHLPTYLSTVSIKQAVFVYFCINT